MFTFESPTTVNNMTTAKELFNFTFGSEALVNSSLYFTKGNKVVRFADHAARAVNFQIHNDNAKEIFVVYVNSGLNERQIQANVSEIEELTGSDVDYTFFEEGDDAEIVKMQIERFLSL